MLEPEKTERRGAVDALVVAVLAELAARACTGSSRAMAHASESTRGRDMQ
jgi:hypothetical protein